MNDGDSILLSHQKVQLINLKMIYGFEKLYQESPTILSNMGTFDILTQSSGHIHKMTATKWYTANSNSTSSTFQEEAV